MGGRGGGGGGTKLEGNKWFGWNLYRVQFLVTDPRC